MAERAADAPRVDALLDRLGDRLSGEAPREQAKRGLVPRPMGRLPPPPAPPPHRSSDPTAATAPTEPPPAAATAPDAAAQPVSDPPAAADAPVSEPEPLSEGDALAQPDVLERFPAAAALDGPPPHPNRLDLQSLEDLASSGSASLDSLPPPAEPSGVGEPSGLAEPSLPRAEIADAFDEFERGELPNDSTRIEADNLLADESTNMLPTEEQAPVLWVEAGKDLGREFTLQEGETAVGRGIDNDIILTDVSVSRKHMRVLLDRDGITLIDLGSGNGTTLNGRRVHRALLCDGDRIEIGETTLVARLPGAKGDLHLQATMAAPVEATSDEQLPSEEIAAPPSPWQAPYASSMPSVAPPPDHTPSRGTSILLGRGTLLVGAALLVIIASMVGAIAMAVLLHEDPVSGVVGATPLPPPGGVTVTTAGAPPTSLPSLGVTPTLPAGAPPVPPPTVTAPAPVTAPPVTAPPVTAPPVTAPPVTAPPATTTVATREPEAQTEERRGATSRRRDEPAQHQSARTRPATASQEPDPRILAAYRRQAFPEASQLARTQAQGVTGTQRSSLEGLARSIDTFARRFPEARRGNLAALEEADRLDRRIAGGQGAFSAELVPRLVAGYVARARGAMQRQPADACQDVRSALRLQSSHPEANTMFRDCEARARRMFTEAQRLERSDAAHARVAYGDVVAMLGNTHPVARDAAARLVALNHASAPSRTPGPSTTSMTTRPRHVDEDE